MYYQDGQEPGSILSKFLKNKKIWRAARKAVDIVVDAAAASTGIPISMADIRGGTSSGEYAPIETVVPAKTVGVIYPVSAAETAPAKLISIPTGETQPVPGTSGFSNIPKETLYFGGALLALMFLMKGK